jgi:hypothetical protein
MPKRPFAYLRGVVVLGLVLLMAAASSGALGRVGQFAASGAQLARHASQRLAGAAAVPVAVADNGDNSGSDNGDNSDVAGTASVDNGDNSGSDNSDNSGSDNGDNTSASSASSGDNGDNSGSDNSDNSGSDNSDNSGSDNASTPVAPAPAAPSAGATAATTEASGTSTGGDSRIALSGDHVVVRVFPWMPAGVTITIRLVDPSTVPPPPGRRLGDLVFRVEARGAGGEALTALPAEVNLSATYSESDVAGSNERAAILYWLDPSTNTWTPAPKPANDPSTNYVSASVTALGAYAVSIP